MTDADRNRLRKLQDSVLDLPHIRRAIRMYGQDTPLWLFGPSARDVATQLFPQHESKFKQELTGE